MHEHIQRDAGFHARAFFETDTADAGKSGVLCRDNYVVLCAILLPPQGRRQQSDSTRAANIANGMGAWMVLCVPTEQDGRASK